MMLKTVFWLAVIVIGMAFLGWLSFSDSPQQAAITLDKQQVQDDTRKAIDKVQEVTEDMRERAEEAVSPTTPSDEPAPPPR
jgi:hypothetical protein